jgi:tetratricopeptide (TPR) repeat protein
VEPPVIAAATAVAEVEPVELAVEGERGVEAAIDVTPAPLPEIPPRPPIAGAEPEAPRPQVLPVDTCLAMYKDGRFAEVVSLGSAALEVHARLAAVSDRPHEAAALLDLVGLSRRELGDREGARDAFRAAVLDAEPLARPPYVQHLVGVVEEAVASAPDPGDADGDSARVRELRECAAALEEVLASVPGDPDLVGAQNAVRDALTAACEQLAATSSAEIGQLTAQAIRSVQDGRDGEALEALERAERLAGALPEGAVADERREEFERRLWWGYIKVGLRRVEIENFDGALEPLFRAIRLGGVDEDRLTETRSALIRALGGLVETRWPAIQQLVVEDAAGARAELEKLSAVLRSATQRGLSQDDLGDAFERIAHLEQVLSHSA